jgi:hypothetical protein
MSLDYHKQFQWDEIMKKAIYLGQYLKERNLYINENITTEEEM